MNGDLQHDGTPVARQTTMREFVAVVFRRKWIIIGLFLTVTATVLAISLTSPTLYVSSGRVLVKRGEQTSVLTADRRIFDNWEQDLANEVELAKSQPVLSRARKILEDRAGEGSAPPALNPGSVEVEVRGKSNVLAIGYVDGHPGVARQVCDALITAYVRYRQDESGVPIPEKFFKSEFANVEADLQHFYRLRSRFTTDEHVVNMTEQMRNGINRLTGLQQRRSELNDLVVQARAQVKLMREMSVESAVDLPDVGLPYSNDALIDLKRRVVEQRARLAQMRERYRDDAPDVISARGTLESLEGLLKDEADQRIRLVESRIGVLEARMNMLNAEIADLEGQLEKIPGKELTLSEIDRQIDVLKVRYSDLVGKSDLARVNRHTSSEINVVLLSPAGPAVATNVRDVVRLALAPAFSLVVGVGLAFFIDGLDITVHHAGQAEEASEIPVLATLRERRRRA
ncbi:MAG: hypothetical protein A2W00_11105 [Candidatus Eisenbacteria bacterium RBG_16_71_46]|nr:MAG: hypothetical protein A2W00_11105 [Candidatus Eisenbacteria bacterium RBG_16_71_46]OGF22794.1 MAG: hypothetical protein A2V63_10410 [Candidatus Eisenbacteria bacterium RBG_19FT_COMBO_70_11]